MASHIKVVVIDQSASARKTLGRVLMDASIEVVGAFSDPELALSKIPSLAPNVVTADINLPKIDGLTLLSRIMTDCPVPVIMVSSLTRPGSMMAQRSMELGAVDVIVKADNELQDPPDAFCAELVKKTRRAAHRRTVGSRDLGSPPVSGDIDAADARPGFGPPPSRHREPALPTRDLRPPAPPFMSDRAIPPKHTADIVLAKKPPPAIYRTTEPVLAFGASTGGTDAIRDVLKGFLADTPIIVMVQHMPKSFTGSLAKQLDRHTELNVVEVQKSGEKLRAGYAYLAPGDQHMLVNRVGFEYFAKLSDAPAVNRHRPAVDVLFRSVAQSAGPNAIGVLMTGMGDDGAEGLLEMRECGAETIAQDWESSVVWGMPGEAVAKGAAKYILPLAQISIKVRRLVSQRDTDVGGLTRTIDISSD